MYLYDYWDNHTVTQREKDFKITLAVSERIMMQEKKPFYIDMETQVMCLRHYKERTD